MVLLLPLEHVFEFFRRGDSAPGFLVAFDQFENKMDATAGGAKSFGGVRAQAHGGEDALHRIGGTQMFPVLLRVIEVTQAGMELRDQRTDARQAFEAIGGDDIAAKAAADRQSALAEMEEIAEQYVRIRSAAVLLRWAIERYRREKQAPLLKRAGELFATLTDTSFTSLSVDFDEEENMFLVGRRATGETVGVDRMSTGSADQLYLALRVAAVEDFLLQGKPLPFVADDLFINFDDERAASGFKVLGQLAEKAQVIFFTHHRHLLEIARQTFGPSVSVINLLRSNGVEK